MHRRTTCATILLHLLFAVDFIAASIDECDFNIVAHSGIIEAPKEDSKHEFCKWTLIPPVDNSRFLVNVLSATLPADVELILYTDDSEYDVNRDCINCIGNIVSSTLKILLQQLPRAENVTHHFPPTFKILYKSFRPGYCPPPQSIDNSIVIGKNYKVGKSIMYVCSSPFQISGHSISKCQLEQKSGIPTWSSRAPSCYIPQCTDGPIKLTATNRGNAIVNPGFESGAMLSSQNCWWDITAVRNDQQIKANFQYFNVFGQGNGTDTSLIQLYDGSLDNLMLDLSYDAHNLTEVVTKSNRLIVVYHSGPALHRNSSGFLMNYSSVSIKCLPLKVPSNADIQPLKKAYGFNDLLKLHCHSGYRLVAGPSQLRCMISGKWSGYFGRCVTIRQLTQVVAVEDVTETLAEVEARTIIMDYDPFSLKTGSVTSILTKPPAKSNKKKYHATKPTKSTNRPKIVSSVTMTPQLISTTVAAKTTEKSKGYSKHNKASEQYLDKEPKKNPGKNIGKIPSTTAILSTTPHLQVGNQNANADDAQSDGNGVVDVEITLIIAGVAIPILLIVIVTLLCVVYRRRFPARMSFGRKFSTYENPMYERRGPHRELLPDSDAL